MNAPTLIIIINLKRRHKIQIQFEDDPVVIRSQFRDYSHRLYVRQFSTR
jgi:hypothetical protein